jgi:hypothetical protein
VLLLSANGCYFFFCRKRKSNQKETSRLHPGLLKFVLWLCLCCPAMLMPDFLVIWGLSSSVYPITSLRGTKQSLHMQIRSKSSKIASYLAMTLILIDSSVNFQIMKIQVQTIALAIAADTGLRG